MLEIRPDLQNAYNSLCYQGEQFPEPHQLIQLDGPTFIDPNRGEVPIKIDGEVLAAQGTLYVGDSLLRQSLEEHGVRAETWQEATSFLDHHLDPSAEELVWGFSGYATGGFDSEGKPYGYAEEAEYLQALYEYLEASDQLPSLAIDGGVSEGFLALNSVIAKSIHVPTLGFLPREGLDSAGIRDHMVVAGETYPDREALVATADMFAFAGGAAATIRECQKAVKNGASGLIFWHEKYGAESLPNVLDRYKDLQEALSDGRLAVCKSSAEIPEQVEKLLQKNVKASRTRRTEVIADFLR